MEYSLGCTADRAANNSDQMITDRCLNNPANELQPNDIKMSEPSPQRKEDQMETQGETNIAKQLALNDLAGITPEELQLQEKTVSDIIQPNLDILFVGINPGYHSALTGHHYSGTGNHFWTCLYQSGLIPSAFTADRDQEVVKHGIGLCNVVSRTTASGQDLSSAEIREGCRRLVEKLALLQPLVACFNGKSIWESFCREMMPGTYKKREFCFGKQEIAPIQGVKSTFYVMPSSSARCAAFPTAETKLPWFKEVKDLKEKIKEEEARKGVAGISGIGINLPKFQQAQLGLTANELSPKVYSGSPRPQIIITDDGKERKGKKRPVDQDLDHPRSKLKHMADPVKKEDAAPITPSVQHRLAGGGISSDMLKDPSENERMERVRRWVNNQDFSRGSPEPPIHGETTQADIYKALLQPPNAMQAMPIIHPHALLHKPELWPALGLSDSYNLPGVSPAQLASTNSAFQGLSSGLQTALSGGSALPTNPASAWPYGAIPSGVPSSLYRFPAIPYEWSKALTGTADSSARVIPFVPVIPASGLAGLSNSLSFVLPGQNQSLLYPPGYTVPSDNKNPPQ